MPMLQDLDSLAARIEQMVRLTRQLQSERTALQARVKSLEDERNNLNEQLHRREADFKAMAGNLAEHESTLKVVQESAKAAQAQLQLELDQCRQRCSVAEQDLLESRQVVQHLRTVSDTARQQIDSILVRLPGAPQE